MAEAETAPGEVWAEVWPDGRFCVRGQVFRAVIGVGGLRRDKSEGDGATPIAHLPLRRVLYRADRVKKPQAIVAVEALAPADGWCDDAGHADYNCYVRLPHAARHEALWRDDGVYDVIGVLGWNDAPVVRGRGSAIFLHVVRPDMAPTEGCVALALADVQAVLAMGLRGIIVRG